MHGVRGMSGKKLFWADLLVVVRTNDPYPSNVLNH